MEILPFLTAVLGLFPIVAAAGLLIAAAVNLVKLINKLRPGTIADGYAGLISLIINAAAWIFLWFAGPRLGEGEAVQMLTDIGQTATLVVVLLTSLLASKVGHLVLGWLGLSVHLAVKDDTDLGYTGRVERVPSFNTILEDLSGDSSDTLKLPRAA